LKRPFIFVITFIVFIVVIVFLITNTIGKKDISVSTNQSSSSVLQTNNESEGQINIGQSKLPENNESIISMDGDMNFKEADVDLDNDGNKENIKVTTEIPKSQDQGGIEEVTGRLQITGKDGVDDISFINKPQSLAGIISGIKFIDLDGDGIKDILISIPDTGNPFITNSLFIFNYKSKQMYSFPGDKNDFSLDEFVKGFTFSYKGNGILNIENKDYNFKGTMNLKNCENITSSEENNKKYEDSWIDPRPVSMDDGAKLMLIKDKDNKVYIRMPLAIYGINDTDVIGEVELYFDVSSDFITKFRRFEIIGYNGNAKVKIGEANAIKEMIG